MKRLYNIKNQIIYFLRKRSPAQIVVVCFALIILLGAGFLSLPIASRNGESHGFLTALFTATSATCVTGLIMGDTWLLWSGFGQAVIICLIQIGGLGFMSVFSIFLIAMKREFGIKNRMMLSQTFGIDSLQGVVRMMKKSLIRVGIVEGTGALVLTIRFLFDFDFFTSLKLGIWHSISAFCNAGFDILGFIEPNSSLMSYRTDFVINIVIMLLIILGGLGFFVWDEILNFKKTRKLSVYTKLVLIITSVLIVGGALLFAILEWNNPNTYGNATVGQKVLFSFFQSVTARTAGFDSVGQGGLTEASKAVTSLLMIIGGSSGSTAGGLKTVTIGIIILSIISAMRSSHNVTIMKRSIKGKQLKDAMILGATFVCIAFFGGTFISAVSGLSFNDCLYEAVSAIATVGLTTGITQILPTSAKILLIIYMFFGRVGILTISMGFLVRRKSDELYRYADTNLLIG